MLNDYPSKTQTQFEHPDGRVDRGFVPVNHFKALKNIVNLGGGEEELAEYVKKVGIKQTKPNT